ncbi:MULTISPECIES: sodium/proline symporter [unclassified Coleofasciculus]|uniref:sodium/proline symporter n=1 Tax=unclassified Coleofasciculus TaxID=2692782 RepID=UPI001880360E|nr:MULTISPECIES: sodium/proline symporter [unclassified Coleofasciculus]MBE9128405.1 sodium/proline symporter [Coleofasciculus sp. LEGE 07081]MBE9150359.1 sodium/proline symporter [Coleofasciculus sp. LEGE 07092]
MIAATFIVFLLLFTGVGIYSATQKQNTTTDYLLASRSVNPWLTALSAMATGQSGLLFIGQVGFAYKIGLSAIWLTIGWAIGDYIAWWFVFKRLRQVSEEISADTVSSFLGQETKGIRWITIISALITIAFLGSYAAAQLVAGGKALYAVFDWNYSFGVIAGAIVVVIYCFSGGIRASIWTDAVQAIIMIGSLLLLLVVAIANCGGLVGFWTQLKAIDPALVSLSPPDLQFGLLPFLMGWMVAGFGVVGQPHIVVRAMAIDSANNIGFARDIKVICGLVTSFSAMGVGMAARVLMPDLLTNGDPELALPYLALELLPALLVGLMLAGLFAATISTADSQILSCSAALTQDLFPATANSYKFAKLGTLTVTIITLIIALAGDNNVFGLITFSWSVLASGLGPLLIIRVWQKPVTTPVAIAMMVVGIAAALIWNLGLQLSSVVYEVLPGMAAGSLVYFIAQRLRMINYE